MASNQERAFTAAGVPGTEKVNENRTTIRAFSLLEDEVRLDHLSYRTLVQILCSRLLQTFIVRNYSPDGSYSFQRCPCHISWRS